MAMGASGGLAVLFVKDGLEAGNILAEGAQKEHDSVK